MCSFQIEKFNMYSYEDFKKWNKLTKFLWPSITRTFFSRGEHVPFMEFRRPKWIIEENELPFPVQSKEPSQLVDIGKCTPIIKFKWNKRVCKYNGLEKSKSSEVLTCL